MTTQNNKNRHSEAPEMNQQLMLMLLKPHLVPFAPHSGLYVLENRFTAKPQTPKENKWLEIAR